MNVKKQALGRGLSALLALPENEEVNNNLENSSSIVGAIASLPIHQIEANPFQPRTDFEKDALNELAQ